MFVSELNGLSEEINHFDLIRRPTNVKCAIEIGMGGLCFQNAESLAKDLSHLGIDLSVPNI